MKTTIHRADSRGLAEHGWLTSRHTFSFADYYDPARTNFGLLRVLNDDIVEGGGGFGTHPHNNMEIISIPLAGALAHRDSMGHTSVINSGDVQIMSAGSGLLHSEYNHSMEDPVNFLQIWIYPKERNIEPRYDQKTFAPQDRVNTFQTVVSPERSGEGLWINQDARLSLASLKAGTTVEYIVSDAGHGVYLFVVEGAVDVAGEHLEKRDAIGIEDTGRFSITADSNAELLAIEVPMK